MHKGRYFPRVHPFAASAAWEAPYFPAKHLQPEAPFIWNGVSYEWPAEIWAEVTQLDELTFEWHGIYPYAEFTLRWQLVQTYEASLGQHHLRFECRDELDKKIVMTTFSDVPHRRFDDVVIAPSLWTEISRDLPPWQAWSPHFRLKRWR